MAGVENPIAVKPRNVKQFKRHVRKLSEKTANNKDGFEQEFSYIEKKSESDFFFEDFTSARLPQNRPKNRYSNVLPLENTRVHLPIKDGDSSSDFINANYIGGDDVFPNRKRWYIAGQGPLKDTVEDFWRMVWNELTTVIVMLTKIIENDRQKCHQYWPRKGCKRVNDSFLVSLYSPLLLDTEELVVQKIRVDNLQTGEYRDMYHFQYREWPDHGLPKSTEKFRQMLDLVDLYDCKRGPIIVHCSAGIGRTGTFCTVHNNLAKLKQQPDDKVTMFDILGTVLRLRKERVGMVQTKEQYMFCYLAVLEGAVAYQKVAKTRKSVEIDMLPLTPNGHELVEALHSHTSSLPADYEAMKKPSKKQLGQFRRKSRQDEVRKKKKRDRAKKRKAKREKICLTDSGTSSDEEPPEILCGRASPSKDEDEEGPDWKEVKDSRAQVRSSRSHIVDKSGGKGKKRAQRLSSGNIDSCKNSGSDSGRPEGRGKKKGSRSNATQDSNSTADASDDSRHSASDKRSRGSSRVTNKSVSPSPPSSANHSYVDSKRSWRLSESLGLVGIEEDRSPGGTDSSKGKRSRKVSKNDSPEEEKVDAHKAKI